MRRLRLLITWFLLTAVIAACAPPPSPQPPAATMAPLPTVAAGPTPIPYQGCVPLQKISSSVEPFEVQSEDAFVPNQIVLTGLRNDIRTVVSQLREEHFNISEEPLNEVSFSYLDKYPLPPDQDVQFIGPFPAELAKDISVQLYSAEPPEGTRLEDLVTQIYKVAIELRQAKAIEYGVYPDPNYLIGRSPVEVNGDPNCGEGSPAGASAPAGQDLFWKQWAFGSAGIQLLAKPGDVSSRTTNLTGKDVRIGVFDTSPFASEGGWTIPWIDPELNLCVSHLGTPVRIESPGSFPDYRDHGLFVSGLVHAVAPDSEIYLIQVLNDDNRGDLDTLVNGLSLFSVQTLGDKGGTLNRTIINLSLGIHPTEELFQTIIPYANTLYQLTVPGYPLSGNAVPVVSLQTVLDVAIGQGAVVAAASGNDSGDPALFQPVEPQIPASYPNVIGVAGTGSTRKLACFSNAGGVAAPSGDNKMPGCAFIVDQGGCETQPEMCMVSLSMHQAPVSGYGYWVGTSFATPLVSGLAALLREKDPGLSSELVARTIYTNAGAASSGAGISSGIADVKTTAN